MIMMRNSRLSVHSYHVIGSSLLTWIQRHIFGLTDLSIAGLLNATNFMFCQWLVVDAPSPMDHALVPARESIIQQSLLQ